MGNMKGDRKTYFRKAIRAWQRGCFL